MRYSLLPALLHWATIAVTADPISAQTSGHGYHPPMPDQQLFLQCRLDMEGKPAVIEEPVRLASPMMSADLDQLVELPAPLPPIRLTKYLGQARLEQNAVPDESTSAAPAMLISVDGPTQSFQRWLLAGDPQRNRLTSFIANWRYMAVTDAQQRDELLGQFRNEMTRDAKLIVSRVDGGDGVVLPAITGQQRTIEGVACSVRVKKFFPHFAMDDKTKKPVNQSEQRLNPAALLEIEHLGQTVQRWVFAKFPEYGQDDNDGLPVRVVLDCPVSKLRSTPDFMLLSLGSTDHEVWTRVAGKTRIQRVEVKEPIEVAGSQYTFHVKRIVPTARLVEEYHPADGKGSVAALRIATLDPSGAEIAVWLELGKQRVLSTASGPMTVAFGPRKAGGSGAHR